MGSSGWSQGKTLLDKEPKISVSFLVAATPRWEMFKLAPFPQEYAYAAQADLL
jgi:hypothetical protein